MIATVPHTITIGDIDVATRSRTWIFNYQREFLLNTAATVAASPTIPCMKNIIFHFLQHGRHVEVVQCRVKAMKAGTFILCPPVFATCVRPSLIRLPWFRPCCYRLFHLRHPQEIRNAIRAGRIPGATSDAALIVTLKRRVNADMRTWCTPHLFFFLGGHHRARFFFFSTCNESCLFRM